MPLLAKAALLGVLQGLTEFLPISSTAHLLIASRVRGYEDAGGVFTVMIQLGSILAIMWLYRERILHTAAGMFSRMDARRFALMIVTASIPAVVAGAFLADVITDVLYQSLGTIAAAFVIGGIVMLVVERAAARPTIHSVDDTPMARAFGVGIFQMLALVPGVSRSGATIVGGMVMGLDRRTAAELSFFLAMPILAGAFAREFVDVAGALTQDRATEIAVGFVTAFLAALVVVRPFLDFVARSGFAPFAWYRIAAGVALYAASR